MFTYDSIGKLWETLLANADENLTNELWISAIEIVAKAKVESEGINPLVEPEEFELLVYGQIDQWIDDALPDISCFTLGSHLNFFFRGEGRFTWSELFCFDGSACPCPLDTAYDMQDRLCPVHDDKRDITEEPVEEFFLEWRYRFLNFVCKVASHEK